MAKDSELSGGYLTDVGYALVLLTLYFSSLYNYTLFHGLVEIITIVIGCCIFILAWHSRQRTENDFFLFLGIAYLFVSGLDLMHTLAYKGMGVFPGYDANLATQLWVAARFIQSFSLLLAPLFLRRKLHVNRTFIAFAAVTVLLLVAVFMRVFPTCFVEGSGLTPFKKIGEYVIAFILLAATGLLYRNRVAFDRIVMRWLIVSLLLTIGAELAFTFYVNVYGLSNLVGHLFKLVAFYLLYVAVVETGLEKPQRLLFRNLQLNQDALRTALVEMRRLAITDPLTGLCNRSHFTAMAEEEIQRARRYQRPLSVIILDVDHFKQVNDARGHASGDELLKWVAECCLRELRAVDTVCRFGGDEFVFMLPESDRAAAGRVAERVRRDIETGTFEAGEEPTQVTASMGVAELGEDSDALETLLSRADQALYRAKADGRNQVCQA